MPRILRSAPRPAAVLVPFALSFVVVACGESSKEEASSGGSGGGAGIGASGSAGSAGAVASGGSSITIGAGIGGTGFNQCGVAAPLPADTGQCTVVSAPAITNFDDYAGTAASSYTYYVNAAPPAPDAVLGQLLHVGDGSDTGGGTSVIATEMVVGVGGAGYALQFSDSNATNWGGLLMLFVPSGCLDASAYQGVAFSIKGSAPSGRYGVNLGMLDTIPTADNGLCTSPTSGDCHDATIQLALGPDAETWQQVEIPWSALTPGIGSGLSCVPVTGQNIVRLVIQPFMNYPPPDYTMQPGPYSIAIDDVRFY
jgi:hypothetical protein